MARAVLLVCGTLALLLTAAACSGGQQPAALGNGSGMAVAPATQPASLDPSSTPTHRPSPTPTGTPTPTATPTPLPVAGERRLPAGRLLFAVGREGEDLEELWQVDTVTTPAVLHEALAAGLWDCGGAQGARCLAVTSGGGLYWFAPDGSAQPMLLAIPPGFELNAAGGAASITALSLAPDLSQAAIADASRLAVVDLANGRPRVTLLLTDTFAMAWSPDSSALAVAYHAEPPQQALAVWQDGRTRPDVLAIASELDHLAWSPDSSRLAFSARPWRSEEDRGAAYRDVFVAFRRSGEVSNVSESGLANADLDPADQVGAWAPVWELDGEALRYIRGVQADPARQEVVRHPLNARRASPLWPVAEDGLLGVFDSPDGQHQARVVSDGDRQQLQVRLADQAWQDGLAVPAGSIQALIWASRGDDAPWQGLVAVEPGILRWLDLESGQATDLAVACPVCRFTRALWSTW